jgi:hypothetical protein
MRIRVQDFLHSVQENYVIIYPIDLEMTNPKNSETKLRVSFRGVSFFKISSLSLKFRF